MAPAVVVVLSTPMEPTVTEATTTGGQRAKAIVESAERRWVFRGPVDVPVAAVLGLGRDELRAHYPAITDDDVAAAGSFDWPPLLRHAAFDIVRDGSLVVLCVCGEGFAVGGTDDRRRPTCPICRRRYAIDIVRVAG